MFLYNSSLELGHVLCEDQRSVVQWSEEGLGIRTHLEHTSPRMLRELGCDLTQSSCPFPTCAPVLAPRSQFSPMQPFANFVLISAPTLPSYDRRRIIVTYLPHRVKFIQSQSALRASNERLNGGAEYCYLQLLAVSCSEILTPCPFQAIGRKSSSQSPWFSRD